MSMSLFAYSFWGDDWLLQALDYEDFFEALLTTAIEYFFLLNIDDRFYDIFRLLFDDELFWFFCYFSDGCFEIDSLLDDSGL